MPVEDTSEKEFEDYFNEALDEKVESTKVEEPAVEDGNVDGDSVFNATPEGKESATTPDITTLLAKIEEQNATIASLNQKMGSWEGRIKKANERAEAAEAKLANPTPTSVEGESDVIKAFKTEFPDFVEPQTEIARQVFQNEIKTVLAKLNPALAQIQQTQQVSAEVAHDTAIKSVHPDYLEIFNSGKLGSWIDAQPAIISKSLHRVCESGSSAEIIEMYNLFKSKSTQTIPTKSSQKAASLMAVEGTLNSPPAQKTDANDFDSAWQEANSKDT